jgi:proteasome lid subunit RPN8/RPN11
VLKISAQDFATMRDHLVAGYPNEACGILIGDLLGDVRAVRQVIQTANSWVIDENDSHNLRDRFEIAPVDIIRADRAAEKNGWDIVGYFHSHPDDKPVPSEFDRERAWPDVSFVIASVKKGAFDEIRSYVLSSETNIFHEEIIEIIETL